MPVNSASMGPQIEYLLANSGAKLLVIEERFVERLATAELVAVTRAAEPAEGVHYYGRRR